eukprot:2841751-Rhodomonas_salina.1
MSGSDMLHGARPPDTHPFRVQIQEEDRGAEDGLAAEHAAVVESMAWEEEEERRERRGGGGRDVEKRWEEGEGEGEERERMERVEEEEEEVGRERGLKG